MVFERAPELVTNEEIVKEAWEIVNDTFLGTDRNRWSPESWLKKKEDIMGTSLQTRSKAHDVIRRMLSSLGDPYTRFISPAECLIPWHLFLPMAFKVLKDGEVRYVWNWS